MNNHTTPTSAPSNTSASVFAGVTGVILAAFVGYIGAWYFGMVEGNFSLLMFIATGVTGIYWVLEKLHFLPQRRQALAHAQAQAAQRQAQLQAQGIAHSDTGLSDDTQQRLLMQPWWLDWTAGLFPVIAAVFILRSFLFEPFKIPSGSMIPTLRIGDLILVNKFHYGVRLPVIHTKLIANNEPQRGDVMVFRYPPQPSLDYIKRVVGVPGDEIAYLNKQLTVNGQIIAKKALPDFFDNDAMRYGKHFEEQQSGKTYRTLNDDERPAFVPGATDFPYKDHCRYSVEGVVCKVPPGHYYLMGDNRDNSLDSRYWGFVPEANIVGKAFFVWMNFGNLSRIGGFD